MPGTAWCSATQKRCNRLLGEFGATQGLPQCGSVRLPLRVRERSSNDNATCTVVSTPQPSRIFPAGQGSSGPQARPAAIQSPWKWSCPCSDASAPRRHRAHRRRTAGGWQWRFRQRRPGRGHRSLGSPPRRVRARHRWPPPGTGAGAGCSRDDRRTDTGPIRDHPSESSCHFLPKHKANYVRFRFGAEWEVPTYSTMPLRAARSNCSRPRVLPGPPRPVAAGGRRAATTRDDSVLAQFRQVQRVAPRHVRKAIEAGAGERHPAQGLVGAGRPCVGVAGRVADPVGIGPSADAATAGLVC